MGQRASQVGALTFSDVRLPADALLGEEGRGFHMMMSVLDKGRVGIAALAVGIGQAGLEAALDYAKQRKQFGKAISDFQGVQWLLADMARDVEAARLLVHSAAAKIDAGEDATRLLLDGQMVRLRHGRGAQRRCGSGLRRQRLYSWLRGRAALSRRQDHARSTKAPTRSSARSSRASSSRTERAHEHAQAGRADHRLQPRDRAGDGRGAGQRRASMSRSTVRPTTRSSRPRSRPWPDMAARSSRCPATSAGLKITKPCWTRPKPASARSRHWSTMPACRC